MASEGLRPAAQRAGTKPANVVTSKVKTPAATKSAGS